MSELESCTNLERDGYVVVRGSVAPGLCDAAAAGLDRFKRLNRRLVERNADDQNRMNRVVNLHGVVDALQPLFSDNSALGVCDRFFDSETALYTSLCYERGSEQDLHRDAPAFTTRPEGRYMGVWVALEDVDAGNGPLVVVPGSHALAPIDLVEMATDLYGSPDAAPHKDQRGWDTYQETVQAQCEANGLEPIEVHVGKGDTIVWHPLLLHGGAAHVDASRTRRTMVFHVTPIDTAVYGQDVFFNPARPVEETTAKLYTVRNGRKIPATQHVDFAHEFTVRTATLHRPDDDLATRVAHDRAEREGVGP